MYAAVKSFNLKVGPKETFGLLGPNGAGKTTLISMITGMFEPNYGNAWIGGYDIKSSIEKAQLQMGVWAYVLNLICYGLNLQLLSICISMVD